MDSVKAKIQGEGVDNSVEFSIEEVIARHHGVPWDEMSPADQEAELKDYALSLFTREQGVTGNMRVILDRGTFSNTPPESV